MTLLTKGQQQKGRKGGWFRASHDLIWKRITLLSHDQGWSKCPWVTLQKKQSQLHLKLDLNPFPLKKPWLPETNWLHIPKRHGLALGGDLVILHLCPRLSEHPYSAREESPVPFMLASPPSLPSFSAFFLCPLHPALLLHNGSSCAICKR